MSEPTNVPTLTRDEIAQRFILKITNAALDEWEKLPDSIASDVMTSVIDILNDELAAFNQSITNRDKRQGTTVSDGHGPHPFDQEFCKEGCQPA